VSESGTFQLILENLKQAAVEFGGRFKGTPAQVKPKVAELLAELGFADPTGIVTDAIAGAANEWAKIADRLGPVSLSGPGDVTALGERAKAIGDAVAGITRLPGAAAGQVADTGGAFRRTFPTRLLDYVIHEALTKSHPKIAAILLLLGVLRRERTASGGNPALIDGAVVRVFDLRQLVSAVTDPAGSVIKVLGWGTDDFNARPPLDAIGLLLKTAGALALGPDDDTFPLRAPPGGDGEDRYVDVDRPGGAVLQDGARLTVTLPSAGPVSPVTISLVGLHRFGLGLAVPNPVTPTGNFNGVTLPDIPNGAMLVLTADPAPRAPDAKIVPRKP